MDYDDEDDEDYNPPSRKPEVATENDKTACSPGKSKRKSPDGKREVCEPSKKEKLEQQLHNVAVVAPCSTCSQSDSPSEDTSPAASTKETDGSSNDSVIEKCAAQDSSYNCFSNPVDTRQPSGEDCQTISPSKSSQEVATNAANVVGSEPYPVR